VTPQTAVSDEKPVEKNEKRQFNTKNLKLEGSKMVEPEKPGTPEQIERLNSIEPIPSYK